MSFDFIIPIGFAIRNTWRQTHIELNRTNISSFHFEHHHLVGQKLIRNPHCIKRRPQHSATIDQHHRSCWIFKFRAQISSTTIQKYIRQADEWRHNFVLCRCVFGKLNQGNTWWAWLYCSHSLSLFFILFLLLLMPFTLCVHCVNTTNRMRIHPVERADISHTSHRKC